MIDAQGPRLRVNCVAASGSFRVEAHFDAGHPIAQDAAPHIGHGITALFGPSGAGKSVTLATIAGLLRPVEGDITIGGRVVADAATGFHVRTQDRRVGMVFQHAALMLHRSPLDNVALAVRPEDGRRRHDRRRIAQAWMERVGGQHLASADTKALSGGERQRVALARALAGRPELLLLDEPFSALDVRSREELRGLLRTLVDQSGTPSVIVTHDLDDVGALADSVVLFQPGRTIAQHPLRRGDRAGLAEALGLVGTTERSTPRHRV